MASTWLTSLRQRRHLWFSFSFHDDIFIQTFILLGGDDRHLQLLLRFDAGKPVHRPGQLPKMWWQLPKKFYTDGRLPNNWRIEHLRPPSSHLSGTTDMIYLLPIQKDRKDEGESSLSVGSIRRMVESGPVPHRPVRRGRIRLRAQLAHRPSPQSEVHALDAVRAGLISGTFIVTSLAWRSHMWWKRGWTWTSKDSHGRIRSLGSSSKIGRPNRRNSLSLKL